MQYSVDVSTEPFLDADALGLPHDPLIDLLLEIRRPLTPLSKCLSNFRQSLGKNGNRCTKFEDPLRHCSLPLKTFLCRLIEKFLYPQLDEA